jgi:hypothetical protein
LSFDTLTALSLLAARTREILSLTSDIGFTSPTQLTTLYSGHWMSVKVMSGQRPAWILEASISANLLFLLDITSLRGSFRRWMSGAGRTRTNPET